MTLKLLLQMAALLAAAQAVLGAAGYLARGLVWVSLPLAAVLVWLIVRAAAVLRTEILKAQRKDAFVLPWATALFVALLWQASGLLLLPFWAPSWAADLWQGVWQWVPSLLGPGVGGGLSAWLWLTLVPEVALFVWLAARPEPPLVTSLEPSGEVRPAAGGEWAPARRFEEAFAKVEAESESRSRPRTK